MENDTIYYYINTYDINNTNIPWLSYNGNDNTISGIFPILYSNIPLFIEILITDTYLFTIEFITFIVNNTAPTFVTPL